MSDGFTLGGIALDLWETPEQIIIPAEQRLAKHVMIGGQRQIDAMGPDPEPIVWRGRARGANATGDMMAIRAMCIAGQQVQLTWNEFSFTVIIAKFLPIYRRPIEWEYAITVEIVDDPQADSGGGIYASVDSLVGADMGTLSGLIQ